MTDAERIAEYLKTTELDEGPLEDIERMYRYRGEVLPSSRYGVTMALRDMLSDVRREEREACAEIAHGLVRRTWTPLDEDIDAQVDTNGEPDAFDITGERIRRAILARGSK